NGLVQRVEQALSRIQSHETGAAERAQLGCARTPLPTPIPPASPTPSPCSLSLRHSRIIGTGSYLPPRAVANDELVRELAARGVETSDQWIVERTGIRHRHLADPGVACSRLATEASRRALEAAGLEATDVDLIIVAT